MSEKTEERGRNADHEKLNAFSVTFLVMIIECTDGN